MFQPDGSASLEEKVYLSLEEQIISQKLRPGESVAEMKLSRELGVSRTPVREALQRLDREGLIKLIPNKGAVVLGISEQDLIDIYKIRMNIGLPSHTFDEMLKIIENTGVMISDSEIIQTKQ